MKYLILSSTFFVLSIISMFFGGGIWLYLMLVSGIFALFAIIAIFDKPQKKIQKPFNDYRNFIKKD